MGQYSLYTLMKRLFRGLVLWGEEVQGLLDDAKLLVQQAASSHGPGLVSLLIEGAPNSGIYCSSCLTETKQNMLDSLH